MMKVRRARRMRRVRKMRTAGKVRAAVLPVGSRAGGWRTVHTPVSSMASGSYHLCLGEISLTWHHVRAWEEGGAEPREKVAGQSVFILCTHQWGKPQKQTSPSN